MKIPIPAPHLRSLAIAAALVSQATAQNPAQINQAEVLYRQGVAAREAGDPAAARQAYDHAEVSAASRIA